MAVNVKMGVDLGGFKSGIQQGTQILKGLNAEMKATEAEFKATGDAEKKLEQQTKTLNSQIQTQKNIIDQAQKALKAMKDAGVKETDAAYQQMYATMMKAQTGMYEAQAALNEIGTSAQQAAVGADKLTQSVGAIGKKVSLDAVISGIDRITDGLEKAAQKALQLGEKLFSVIMDAAARADDISTMATQLGLTDDEVQRMMYVAAEFEAPVEQMAKTWKKVKMNMTSDSEDVMKAFKEVGAVVTRTVDTGFGKVEETAFRSNNYMDIFWQTGEALMKMTDATKQERLAQTLLGRSWDELLPLFKKGRKAYEEALAGVTPASDDAVENAAALNDRIKELEQSWETLKLEVIGAVAPALSKGAEALSSILDRITEYLQTPEGKKALEDLGTAVSGLFDDLGKIDPASVVENFTTVFNGLVTGLQWIVDNKDTLIEALKAVVIGWAGLKLTGGALQIWQMVNGLINLTGKGATTAGAGAGASAGAAAGGGGISAWLSGALSQITGSTLTNATAVGDWFMNHTNVGRAIGGKHADTWESVGNDFENWQRSVERNINSFGADWANLWKAVTGQQTEEPKVTVQPEFPPDARQKMEEELNTNDPLLMKVRIQMELEKNSTNYGGFNVPGFANGLSYVPYDGMLARLHKGERVVPAREAGRNFSSNLYVENMNMNGGLSADAMASAIASRNWRVMAGYGS